MKKELIISHEDQVSKIALLEDGRLMELHESQQANDFVVGDIFIGKVKKLAPNLNAAFVDLGYNKDAFLHYHDLGPQFLSYKQFTKDLLAKKQNAKDLVNVPAQKEILRDDTIDKVLVPNDLLLLQITKEPISTKGPRISAQISLTGRFLVMIPFDKKVSVSKKIKSLAEKNRLKDIAESLKPEGFGIIVRTVAEGKEVEDLHQDIQQLLLKWEAAIRNIHKASVPNKIMSEEDTASAILRDNFNSDFVNVICDDEIMVNQMKTYMETISEESKNVIQLYDSHIPLFEYYNIEKQLKQSFGKFVNIPSSKGAYLVVEHTEALHVIDVNSGNNISKNSPINTEHGLHVNKQAATEIARQLRLRDMGGIIVIDFIDMPIAEHRRELYEHFKEAMSSDKARHKILQPSKFGLIQMTRQRVRPEKNIETNEENPNKDGESIQAPIVVIESMEERIAQIIQKEKSKVYLHVHPFVEAYLTKGLLSLRTKWFLKHKKWVRIIARDSFKYLEYKIYNEKKQEIQSDSN